MDTERVMRLRYLLPVLLLPLAGGCDSALNLEPTDEVADERAITDANSARAALAGAYDAVQDLSYYGGDFLFFSDLSSDIAIHVGTYSTFADADDNDLRADNSTIKGIWDAIYIAIGRANLLIEKLPSVPGLDSDELGTMIGEAHFLRALHYHNLVKLWGGVPIRTTPPASVDEASKITRSTVAQVYDQILRDLDKAEELLDEGRSTRRATLGAVHALRSRVFLYLGDWAGAEAAADEVLDMGYELAPKFSDLFSDEGSDTREDIFRVSFTAQEYNLIGYYYISRSYGGRREIAPSAGLANAYADDDARGAWSISYDNRDRRYGSKYPTTVGAEDVHVIRLAEVILNRAEALARQNRLGEAVDAYNLVRNRAGVAAHVYLPGVTTQAEVIDAILEERRLELAFEGDRWPDLVRTGRAVDVLEIGQNRTLFPIPQRETEVAPGIKQNPGY